MSAVSLSMLKRRIKSVESTMKITKAMSMVSNSKYTRCKSRLYKNNEYMKSFRKNIDDFLWGENFQEYVKDVDENKKLIVIYTSDSGLCGPYNSAIAKLVSKEDLTRTKFIVCGTKGRDFLSSMGGETIAEYVDIPYFADVKESRIISNKIISHLKKEKCQVYGVYFKFISSLKRELMEERMFPPENDKGKINYDTKDISVDDTLSLYLDSLILHQIQEAKVSELSFRIETTNNAIKNGKDILKDLKKKYNKIRQSNITNEISEIVGGVEALNKG